MSLKNYSREELKDLPMINIAREILQEEKKALHYREIFDRVAELKEFSKAERKDKIVQLYTDMNMDGYCMHVGEGVWGLRNWYSVEQQEEEVVEVPKKKRVAKKASKAKVTAEDITDLDVPESDMDQDILGFDEDVEDEFEDLEDEIDEKLSDEDEDDDLDKDDTDIADKQQK